MKSLMTAFTIVCLLGLTLVGCRRQADVTDQQTGPSPEGAKYLLTEEPGGSESVIGVREKAQHNDEIVIVGRIGGRVDPWTQDLAAFSIIDRSLKSCSDIPGDMCKTPWDYCCEPDLATATALVKVVGDDGKPVKMDARKLLNVKELSTVVVKGRAERDDAGNLTVLATGIFVKE